MDSKTHTKVNIGGREYAIAGFESEEYIHWVAITVDRKMSELSKQYPGLSPHMLSVLVSINIADDLMKKTDECAALEIELNTLREELKRFRIEYALAKEDKQQQQAKKVPRVFESLK